MTPNQNFRRVGLGALLLALLLAPLARAEELLVEAEKDTRTPVPLAELNPAPDEKTLPWGAEVDGLACRLIVTPQVVGGQPIRYTVQVRNSSKKTRYLYEVFDPRCTMHVVLQVTGPDGKPVKPTSSYGSLVTPLEFKPIPAGETRRYDIGNLRNMFTSYAAKPDGYVASDGFAKEGKYTLTLTYKGPKCPERYLSGQKTVMKDGKTESVPVYADAPKEILEGAWSGTLIAPTVSVEVKPLTAADLTVHEWGVFTVFNDVKYANLSQKAEWASLPAEFYRQFPERRLRWVPSSWKKPIIYFYSKQPSLRLDVKVRFPEGAPVVWWPACTDPVDDGGRDRMRPGTGQSAPKLIDRLRWSGWLGPVAPRSSVWSSDADSWVKVQDFELPKGGWLHDARLASAAPFTVVGSRLQHTSPWDTNRPETERFIFYDGLLPAPDCLHCGAVTEEAVTVQNRAKFPLGQVFVVDRRPHRRGQGAAVAYQAAAIAAGGEATLTLAPAKEGAGAIAGLKRQVRQALLDTGLFEAEADAILHIWQKEFFEAEGITLFYVFPQAEYDRLLPLEVCPKPVARPVRVGVALHPHFENGPKVRQGVAALIEQLDAKDFATRDAATKGLEQFGPWAVPQLEAALAGKPSLEVARRLEQLLAQADAGQWLKQATPASGPAAK